MPPSYIRGTAQSGAQGFKGVDWRIYSVPSTQLNLILALAVDKFQKNHYPPVAHPRHPRRSTARARATTPEPVETRPIRPTSPGDGNTDTIPDPNPEPHHHAKSHQEISQRNATLHMCLARQVLQNPATARGFNTDKGQQGGSCNTTRPPRARARARAWDGYL